MEQMEAKPGLSSAKAKNPLEEVKNILAPLRLGAEHAMGEQTPVRPSKSSKPPVFETPISRSSATEFPSAMKGVVLTATGETLETPSRTEFAKLFMETPKVNLDFSRIFESDSEPEDGDSTDEACYDQDDRPISSASTVRGGSVPLLSDAEDDVESTPKQPATARPTRLRRPSIRANSQRPLLDAPFGSASTAPPTSASQRKPRPNSRQAVAKAVIPIPAVNVHPPPAAASSDSPKYDFSDEENLPSPFLKKIDRERIARTKSVPAVVFGSDDDSTSPPVSAAPAPAPRARVAPRKSIQTLRAVAVVNAAHAAGRGTISGSKSAGALSRLGSGRPPSAPPVKGTTRSSIMKAQRTSEEVRKALSRP